ncbi:MAG: dethiobiotin synthase [Bernardetiaceae bacterium]|nr:dethiobiotin synthase [Bernardetiaceae bacterium]
MTQPQRPLFITAIGTDSGKTLVSAIVTEALQADYWKPVQSGLPRDTETVQSLVSNTVSQFHREAYLLREPLSPHASAAIDGVQIELNRIHLPITPNRLVIEGAGGILVPLNDTDFVIDLAERFAAEVILVANLYLGSINHTLLSVAELKRRAAAGKCSIKGLIFNRCPVETSEQIILRHAGLPCLLRIGNHETVTKDLVKHYAAELRGRL